jgi:diguanylate cyclase (GGDEF)-like protein/PAS domain S-box-containing protein
VSTASPDHHGGLGASVAAPAASGTMVAHTASLLTLLVTSVAVVEQLLSGDALLRDHTDWLTIHLGAAVQLAVIAAVVLVARHGWNRLATRLAILAVAVPGISVVAHLALTLGAGGSLALDRGGPWWWIAAEQTTIVHLLLGLVLLATPWHGRILGGFRAGAWLVAMLAPAASLSTYAYGSGGYSLVPGISPTTGLAAAMTFVMALGVAAVAPDRWPVRALVQDAGDLVLVRRLLPFIVLMPVIGPILITTARAAGAAPELTAVVGTLGPSVVLVGLLVVTLRDHRALTDQLDARDRQLRAILDALPQAVHLHAANGALLHLNAEGERIAARLHGVGDDVPDVETLADRVSLLDRPDLLGEDGTLADHAGLPPASVARTGRSHGATIGFPLQDGSVGWYAVRAAPVPLEDETTGIVITYVDVTERQLARSQLALAERSLRSTFDHAPIGVAVVAPGGDVLQVNAALGELLGDPDATALASGFWEVAHPDDHEDDLRLVADCLSGAHDRYLVERRLLHTSGSWIWTQMSVALVRDDEGTPLHFIAQLVDLSERRALEHELRVAAVQDPLTGLVNRRALTDRLAEADRRRARHGSEIGVLYLDLDGFKPINDHYGHEVGDRVLIEVARRLTAETREVDTVCRIGGDEFVVLCAPIEGVVGLTELATRLERMRPISVLVDGATVEVGASIGATLVRQDEGLDAALRRADAAMYRAKRDAGKPRGASGTQVPDPSRFPAGRPLRHRVG